MEGQPPAKPYLHSIPASGNVTTLPNWAPGKQTNTNSKQQLTPPPPSQQKKNTLLLIHRICRAHIHPSKE